MSTRPKEWQLDPGEKLVAEARVQPPGRIEAQSTSAGFDLCLTNQRLLVSQRRSFRNGNRTSIVDSIPLEEMLAVRTEKRHPASTFGIPVYSLELCGRNGESVFAGEAGSFWIARLQKLVNGLIEQRPELATQPWPENTTIESSATNAKGPGPELNEEQLVKAKRILALLIAALVIVTTAGILLWRSEDHPGKSFALATIVLLVALRILMFAWQVWERIRRSIRRPEPLATSAPNFKDASYAPFGRRAVGFLIDLVGISVIPIVAGVLYAATNVTTTASGSSTQGGIVTVTIFAAFFFYPFFFLAIWSQTPGMKIMRIQLFTISTMGSLSPVGRSTAAGRTAIALGFSVAFVVGGFIDYLWALGGQRHQCVHDKWTGTIALDIRSGLPLPSQGAAEDGALDDLPA